MRVFVSSVITGFEAFRDAAADAAKVLHHDVVRAEDFPAIASTPQQACLSGVRMSDVVVLLLGSRYGHRQASGMSATEEEFEEAIRSKPILVFEQLGIDREPDMAEFTRRVQDWAGGTLSSSFTTPAELRDRVIAALADHAVREHAGQIDDAELVERAQALLPQDRNQFEEVIAVAVACGPTQQVLRPAETEDPQLCEDLKREAMFGLDRVIDSDQGARCTLRGHSLVIRNEQQQVLVDPLGSIAVFGRARPQRGSSGGLNPIIEEDLTQTIATSLRFISKVLDRIDPTARLSAVAPVVVLLGGAVGWQTRAEHEANPNRMSGGIGGSGNPDPLVLTPSTRPRPLLSRKADELAEDFTVLLRRQFLR